MDPIEELSAMIKHMNNTDKLTDIARNRFIDLITNYKPEECWKATFEQMKNIMIKKIVKKEVRPQFTNLFENFYKDYVVKKNKKPVKIPNKIVKDDNMLERRGLLDKHKVEGNKITLGHFANRHIMYLVDLNMNDADGRPLCKIGYSADVTDRLKKLKKEFDTDIILLSIKRIKSEQIEKELHSLIKVNKSHLCVPLMIGNKRKEEIYVYDKGLVEEFNAVACAVEEDVPKVVEPEVIKEKIENSGSILKSNQEDLKLKIDLAISALTLMRKEMIKFEKILN
ncbi:MAG: hypothetical protein Hyperionvirus2_113 [Hyperionvirus sp.]|uniref:Uncharacterized protein n=1 Tax=Hyperionvirus sp. TaxID=2487770 RepID=A0A3G5A667_9VIRU|nr:MAG: hypothetical protein Hyperionvirus2_113 [Hyperionvirus sp.]